MLSRFVKYRDSKKVVEIVVFFLLAVLVSEVAVVLTLGFDGGLAISKSIASAFGAYLISLERLWGWIYKMVGPMLFPLLTLTIIEVWCLTALIRCWKRDTWDDKSNKHCKVLEIVEGTAPGFGFLGTCISLILTMHRMDPDLSQTAMLKVLLDNSSSAFGSTVYGISLAITAFLAKEIFDEFLMQPKGSKETDKQRVAVKKQTDAASMDLIQKRI